MENTRIFSFVGLEHEEIPYYIAQELSDKGRNVLVIDNSIRHNLFLSLNRLDEDADYVEAGKVIYLRNKKFSQNNFAKFDAVIIFHGMNLDKELLDESDRIILVMDYLASDIRELEKNVDFSLIRGRENVEYLFKDRASGKISEKYIKNILGMDEVEDETSITFDENDYAMKVAFQYNGIQQVKGLSVETRQYINNFLDDVIGNQKKRKKEEKVEKKATKKGEKK